jgi:membrane protein DedA with SNARE-associated domain
VLGVSAWYYAGYPLGTWLVLHDQAVTAELLRGSIPAMILSGAQVRASGLSPWVALLAPLPITWCTDPCFFFGGRRYGRALMEFLGRSDPRWNRRLARGERIYARWAGWAVFLAPVVFFPGSVFYFLAGETRRMPSWQFILLDGAGELAFIAEVVALGFIVGKPAENVVNALSNYSLPIIVGTVVLVIVISVLGSRRGAGMRPGSSG